MADELLFLTELLGLKVYDLKGRRLGFVKDAAIVPLIHPSRVDRYLLGGGWAWLIVRHDQVRSISLDGIHLKDELLTPYHSDEYMLRLVRDLIVYCAKNMARYNPINISGYHISEAGANAVQELAFTMCNAVTYVEEVTRTGMPEKLGASTLAHPGAAGTRVSPLLCQRRW